MFVLYSREKLIDKIVIGVSDKKQILKMQV